MSRDCQYVREHYGVPAQIGRRVIAYGEPGQIIEDRGHYIGVVLDSDKNRRVGNYHPVDGIEYGEMAELPPVKRWEVLVRGWDWSDPRAITVSVSAPTRAKAKYKAWYDCEFHDIECMLGFKARLSI